MLTEIDASVTRFFVGARLTEAETTPDRCECTVCNRTLREGERCTVYATHGENSTAFRLDHLYCREYAPEAVTAPTQGVSEYLLESRLGRTSDASTQRSFPTLLSVELVATSPPDEGSTDQPQKDTTKIETASAPVPTLRSGPSSVSADSTQE